MEENIQNVAIKALETIKSHMEYCLPTGYKLSSVWCIANQTLEKIDLMNKEESKIELLKSKKQET